MSRWCRYSDTNGTSIRVVSGIWVSPAVPAVVVVRAALAYLSLLYLVTAAAAHGMRITTRRRRMLITGVSLLTLGRNELA
jgi:hypothetical protein